MPDHKVVSRDEWIAARKELLANEKEFTRRRDQLSRARRELPWVQVEKEYVFEGTGGRETLADLFDGHSQLVVQHFMFDPSWDEGCKSCSFWVDNFNGISVHLNHRDVTMVLVSKAPLVVLQRYQERMGWTIKWVSSFDTDFNRDFQVSFTDEERSQGRAYYNYAMGSFPAPEAPGISVFYKDASGTVFHTYSCYARGLDMLNGTYHLLDLVPKGRDEEGLPSTMAWLRHHDRYDDQPVRMLGGLKKPPSHRG
jgi:predicted dithiol-disulfide oxidoreductase (DUF899 family)